MKRNRHAGRKRSGGLGLDVFTPEELEDIHLSTLQVLEHTGVLVDDDAAMDYFLFTDRLREEALTGQDSATLAWAAAALYGITRRRLCYDAAEKIAQAWIQKQRPDGAWRAGRDEAAGLALTIQNALCLAETLREAQ